MADSTVHSTTELSHRLSSLSTFLPAVEQLQRLLIPYLTAHPQNLLSLIETAKCTLKRYGIRLHKFAKCPAYLCEHKEAYFALLDDLQASIRHSSLDLSDRELQVQLSRLLFPLTTQMNIATTSSRASRQVQARQPNSTAAVHIPSPRALRLRSSSPTLPPNAMPPPLEPYSRMTTRSKPLIFNPSSRRVIDIVHSSPSVNGLARTAASVRRHFRQNSVISFDDSPSSQSDDSGEDEVSDDSDDEEEDKVSRVVIARPPPLRRSFGIFCTGKTQSLMSRGPRRQRP